MPKQYRPITSSLRSRLLILTIVFISAFEALVYFPAIAMFRHNFLEEKIVAAQIAGLSLVEAPFHTLSPELEEELLETAGVVSVVIRRQDRSLMLGIDRSPVEVNASFDLRSASLASMISDALETLDAKGNRVVRVVGEPSIADTRYVEATVDEDALYVAMAAFSNNMLVLSVVISLFSGIIIYFALHWMVVRPMNRVKTSIASFRMNPETWQPPLKLTKRADEIGVVERELLRMQAEIQRNLKQKTKLAELGEAVAKINHDLRNILATTQLASDALNRVEHPRVRKISSRLMKAVARAVALCERTLKHGRADEPLPSKKRVSLYDMAADVGGTLGLLEVAHFTFDIDVPQNKTILADEEQFHRVLMNLCRNAADIQGEGGYIRISMMDDLPHKVEIRIEDHGPGIPDAILPDLFKPFRSGRGAGGSGLGLSIARDIVVAHGGQLALEKTGPKGTAFILCLPRGNKS